LRKQVLTEEHKRTIDSMKCLLGLIFFVVFLAAGFAHGSPLIAVDPPLSASSPLPVLSAAGPDQTPVQSTDAAATPKTGNAVEDENPDYTDDARTEERGEIADPLEPFNRAMYQFNDKLYFWMLKPVAQGYGKVVPEEARVSVKNFFFNLGFPIRFISCLLQADFSGAATEFGRFTINTIWGIGGLLDPAGAEKLNLAKQDNDLGQTLGVYGVGQGFYIVWPLLGPSSPRDSIEIAGEYFLYPVSYITPVYAWLGVRATEVINDTSLRIGDYESLKEAAIDPYVAMRNAYVQYRIKKIKARQAKSVLFKAEDVSTAAPVAK
jgi:phospholipid-binding lipoprotein MlaA